MIATYQVNFYIPVIRIYTKILQNENEANIYLTSLTPCHSFFTTTEVSLYKRGDKSWYKKVKSFVFYSLEQPNLVYVDTGSVYNPGEKWKVYPFRVYVLPKQRSLPHLRSVFPFYTPWKHQKTFGFLDSWFKTSNTIGNYKNWSSYDTSWVSDEICASYLANPE